MPYKKVVAPNQVYADLCHRINRTSETIEVAFPDEKSAIRERFSFHEWKKFYGQSNMLGAAVAGVICRLKGNVLTFEPRGKGSSCIQAALASLPPVKEEPLPEAIQAAIAQAPKQPSGSAAIRELYGDPGEPVLPSTQPDGNPYSKVKVAPSENADDSARTSTDAAKV